MKSYELVSKVIKGESVNRTPVYGWVRKNLSNQLTESFGSVENFEDKYEFDMAHIFGGPSPYNKSEIEELRSKGTEITPEVLLSIPLNDVNDMSAYNNVIKNLDFYKKQRERFCYMQTPGILECLSVPFGIENHLCYLALYPDELKEVYTRQAEWNKQFASNIIDLGMDMIHVSDDWGAQRSLMFSYDMYKEMIYPYHKVTTDYVKSRGAFLSLHSDGCIANVVDDIVELGYDVLHPWQEAAGMSYDLYLEKYQDKLTILGGVCIQTTLGFGNYENLESEIKRVFNTLKGKRWLCCTTHFVQDHCSIDELVFAYDLITKLARD